MITEGYSHKDHPALANQLFASYAKAVRVRILASVVGRDGLTEPDHQYLEFADRFERDLVRLARLSDAQIAHYLQGGSEPHA